MLEEAPIYYSNIFDETMKRIIKPHHVHIGSHLAYLCLN